MKAYFVQDVYGHVFEVLVDNATCTLTGKVQVVYRETYGNKRVWIRDAHEFHGRILHDGKMKPRFKAIKQTIT